MIGFIGIIVEVPDKEHLTSFLADLLDPELCHSGSALSNDLTQVIQSPQRLYQVEHLLLFAIK